jgi:hypothetical protein
MFKIGNDFHSDFKIVDPISKDENIIDCNNNTKVIRYLGAPLAMRKLSKMKWFETMLTKMHHKATKIAESGLKITQIIAAIKTFVLPMSEYLLRHSNVSKTKLNSLDGYFRKLINKQLGGLPVTKETFYIPAKEGGFGLYSLHDRYDICKVANLGHLLSSTISDMMKRYIEAIESDRRIPLVNTIEEMQSLLFFNWKTDTSYEIDTMRGAAHCEIYEAFKACKNFKIGINYTEGANLEIFPGSDLRVSEEDRKPFFLEPKTQSRYYQRG